MKPEWCVDDCQPDDCWCPLPGVNERGAAERAVLAAARGWVAWVRHGRPTPVGGFDAEGNGSSPARLLADAVDALDMVDREWPRNAKGPAEAGPGA